MQEEKHPVQLAADELQEDKSWPKAPEYPASPEFRKALDNALTDVVEMKAEFGDPAAQGNPINRVIETEEEAEQLLKELKEEQDPKIRKLKAKAAFQAQLDQMDRIWKTLPRKRKRQLMKPKFKFSNRVKSLLQRAGK